MAAITSRQHAKVRQARRFLDSVTRKEEGRFLAEGLRLLEEAFESGLACDAFFYSEKLIRRPRGRRLLSAARAHPAPVYEVSEAVLDTLKDTKTAQGAVGLFRKAAPTRTRSVSFLVMACEIRDPGNLGTLARICEAAGADELLVTPGTVEPYNPKSLRAGAGSLFRLPVIQVDDPLTFLRERKEEGFQIAAAVPREGSSPSEIRLNLPTVLLIGQEAGGIPESLVSACTHRITIPMAREVESLNAALAAGILMYERIRQKKTG